MFICVYMCTCFNSVYAYAYVYVCVSVHGFCVCLCVCLCLRCMMYVLAYIPEYV